MSLLTRDDLYPALFLTYGSAVLGVLGAVTALHGNIRYALLFMVIAGLFDTFDGLVARLIPQTSHQKLQGVVSDSLADLVSFGALPAITIAVVGGMHWPYVVAAGLYTVASIHRLAVFTATAIQDDTPTPYFTGVPVIAALLLPVLYIIMGPSEQFPLASVLLLLLLAISYVSSLHIPKPHGRWAYICYASIATILVCGLLWR